MQIVQHQCDTVLTLPDALDNSTAEEVRKALLAHLEHHAEILLNLSQIERCDAAGVQVLLAMQRSAAAAAKPFAVVATTDALTTVCAALGISSAQFVAATVPLLESACTEREPLVE